MKVTKEFIEGHSLQQGVSFASVDKRFIESKQLELSLSESEVMTYLFGKDTIYAYYGDYLIYM